MIGELKPYAAMKDSGLPWLGNVPKHWEIKRGKSLFRCIDVRSSTGEEELLTVSSNHGVLPRRSTNVTMFKAESYVGHKLCWLGDLVINSLWAWAGGLGVSRHHGIISTAYSVYRLRPEFEDYSSFIHQLVRSSSFQWELQVRSKGIWISRLQLTDESFLNAPFPLPPPDEQHAIVRYLDHMDRRIRRFIRAKQKLIALLTEQKQAIVHRAVTRGLDANVKLKESGVEWLGEVPEHWEVLKLGRIIDLTTGYPFKSDGFSQNESDVRLLRGINIAPGHLRWDEVVRWTSDEYESFSGFHLVDGDLVLGMDRPIVRNGVRVAKVKVEDLPSLLLQRVARIRTHSELQPDFLFLILAGRSFADYLAPIFTGISVPHISPEQIQSFRLALPDVHEQTQIMRWLQEHTSILDKSIEVAHHEISLLQEYRTRLIADVVTGKVDVREVAAGLPEEGEEDVMESGEEEEVGSAEELLDDVE